MDLDQLEELKAELGKLTAGQQDYLAGFLLVERMKRNQLVMPVMHKRIEDSDKENWTPWEKTKSQLGE